VNKRDAFLERRPWFWGKAGLLLKPWYPDFDPVMMIVTSTTVQVRLPNLPIHFLEDEVFEKISNTLGRYQYCISRIGESIGERLECNFSVTSAENIGISWKMLQDWSNSEYLRIFRIYRTCV